VFFPHDIGTAKILEHFLGRGVPALFGQGLDSFENGGIFQSLPENLQPKGGINALPLVVRVEEGAAIHPRRSLPRVFIPVVHGKEQVPVQPVTPDQPSDNAHPLEGLVDSRSLVAVDPDLGAFPVRLIHLLFVKPAGIDDVDVGDIEQRVVGLFRKLQAEFREYLPGGLVE